MNVLSTCISVCLTHIGPCGGQKCSLGHLKLEKQIVGSCHVGAEKWNGSLGEQQVWLTSKPVLQSTRKICFNGSLANTLWFLVCFYCFMCLKVCLSVNTCFLNLFLDSFSLYVCSYFLFACFDFIYYCYYYYY